MYLNKKKLLKTQQLKESNKNQHFGKYIHFACKNAKNEN